MLQFQESLSQDYYATYWQQRYSLRQEIPGFITSYAKTILTTGKYLNAMRECGHIVQVFILSLSYQYNNMLRGHEGFPPVIYVLGFLQFSWLFSSY